MKRLFTAMTGIALVAFMSLSLAGPASAANETATVDLEMKPQSGKLSTTGRKPVDWRVGVEIKAPFPASAKVQPIKNVRATFPSDMTFNPKSSTPICPDTAVGPTANLNFEPNTVIARCPNAVLGNGTAGLYLAGNQNGTGPTLTDPVLIVFNGGTSSAGLPKIKIYGYSAGTGVGIYMEGVLDNGVLDISIPRLSFDSGTGDFNLNIPGSNSPFENRRGVDKSYVQAKCSTGTWLTNATFQLGTRDSAGNPTSPTETISAPESTTDCVGEKTTGFKKGFLARPAIKAAKRIKSGKALKVKIRAKNGGGSRLKKVRVCLKTQKRFIRGSAKRCRILPILPGKSGKTVTLKVRTKKVRKNSRTKLTALVSAAGKFKSASTRTVLRK